jgi:hypothetical protein
MLYFVIISVIMPNSFTLSVTFRVSLCSVLYAECHYANFCYVVCFYTEHHCAECRNIDSRVTIERVVFCLEQKCCQRHFTKLN